MPRDGRTPSCLPLEVFVRSHDRLESYASACWSMSNLSVPGGWTCVITPGRVTPIASDCIERLSARVARHVPRGGQPELQRTARTGRQSSVPGDKTTLPYTRPACGSVSNKLVIVEKTRWQQLVTAAHPVTVQAGWVARAWMRRTQHGSRATGCLGDAARTAGFQVLINPGHFLGASVDDAGNGPGRQPHRTASNTAVLGTSGPSSRPGHCLR